MGAISSLFIGISMDGKNQDISGLKIALEAPSISINFQSLPRHKGVKKTHLKCLPLVL